MNSASAGEQRDPIVAMDADGDFVVVWQDESGADGDGVKVTKVKSKTDAALKGLKAGDVILKFNGQEVQSAESLTKSIQKARPRKIVPVLIKRGDVELDLEIKLDARK